MHTKKQRLSAFILCVLFLMIIFFSVLFIIKESNHHCTGENCPVCACIHQVQDSLKQFGNGSITKAVFYFVQIPFLLLLIRSFFSIPRTSLISQKVRLNN